MKLGTLLATCSTLLLLSTPLRAGTAYGDLNNFDTINDTGVPCHGFEIEIEDLRSRDITYTYDWNHYGPPRITEDSTDPLHPRVTIRYASSKLADGTWAAFTAVPATQLAPTDGHSCTDPSVNFGCEHFGVGYYGAPTVIRYFWLIDDGFGSLVRGPSVNIATPSFVYYPPVVDPVVPNAPPLVPARVQAVIQAPEPAEPTNLEFGPATWVKEIRTTTHNNGIVELRDLVSDDPDRNDDKNWRNGEPDEVEVEWQLMQTEYNKVGGGVNGELKAAEEELPVGDEVVTRRYEFFKYTGPVDPETGEALADNVAPDGIHGVGMKTAGGVDYDLSTFEVVGAYIGAQMASFDVVAPLGLIDHLQDGEADVTYVERTMVVGGNSPYLISITAGSLPDGMSFDSVTGVISGTPAAGGIYRFTLEAMDGDGTLVSKEYQLNIVTPSVPVGIFDLLVTAITTDSVTITWTTDQPASSQVQIDSTLLPADPALTTAHSVTIAGLSPSTAYRYVVMSVNEAGLASASPEATFTTASIPAPIITDIQVVNITPDSATITWTTDQAATSQLQLDATLLPLYPALVTAHTVTLTGLSPATLYHFIVSSANAAGVGSVSPEGTFTTAAIPAPIITDIQVGNLTPNTATIRWNTDQPSTTQLSLNSAWLSEDAGFVTAHQVSLTGLTPDTTYRYQVRSVNSAGVETVSPEATFTTPPAQAPIVSGSGRILEMRRNYILVRNQVLIITPQTIIRWKSKEHEIEEGDRVSYTARLQPNGTAIALTLEVKHK